ncbi:hypothetical protein NLO98_24295 [Pseudomonas syringae]|nr:hypothetical protein [Pseudomonas syringae]
MAIAVYLTNCIAAFGSSTADAPLALKTFCNKPLHSSRIKQQDHSSVCVEQATLLE